jgi:hypothetical protein
MGLELSRLINEKQFLFTVNFNARMSKTLTEKRLIIINFIIVLYFLFIYAIHRFQLENTLIGVFKEILTIPFLLAQTVFLVLGFLLLIKNKKSHFLTKLSVLLLGICAVLTIGSFF